MEQLTKEEIRESIILDLEKAFEEKDVFYLERLPMIKEYDEEVHKFMKDLSHSFNDRDYYNILIDELVEHYYINQENYNFD